MTHAGIVLYTTFAFICLHSFPACHTVELSTRAEPLGSSMHLHVEEIRVHHHEGRPVLFNTLFSPCLLSCTVNLLSGCNPTVIHMFTFSGQFLVSLTWRLFSQQRILGVSLEVPFNIKGQVRLHKLCARCEK